MSTIQEQMRTRARELLRSGEVKMVVGWERELCGLCRPWLL